MPRFRSVADGRQLLPLNGCLKRSAGERGVAEERGEEGVREEGGRKEGGRGRGEKETEEENKVLDRTRLPQEGEGDIQPKEEKRETQRKPVLGGWSGYFIYVLQTRGLRRWRAAPIPLANRMEGARLHAVGVHHHPRAEARCGAPSLIERAGVSAR